MTRLIIIFIALFIFNIPHLIAQNKTTQTENLILITLDGMRWQEIFRGVDKRFFDQEAFNSYHYTHEDFKKEFWHENINNRRKNIFPFIWNTIAKEGQIYGNRDKGSLATITNEYHFSYPGYNEILTGYADPRIDSNDKILNPNKTFLEWLNDQPKYKGKIAAFGSWDVFPYILNNQRTNIFINAGFDSMAGLKNNIHVKELNQLQKDIPSPWDTVRLDAFTYNFAIEYLKEKRPKVLYISFGETDDFAHNGYYDQYILAAKRTDDYIRRIWEWIQSDPEYKNKTTLLITTDHGRGDLEIEHWKHHGRFEYTNENGESSITTIPGDDAIWVAVIGPDTPATGEMQNVSEIKQSQIARTLVKFLDLDYQIIP